MKKLIFFLFAIYLAPTCLAAEYLGHYTKSLALVVGINEYPLWPQLEYATQDAEAVGSILNKSGFTVLKLLDKQATRENILAAIEKIMADADANTQVFVYFAGHGQTEDLPGGGERGYIVPVDADVYAWQQTMLPLQDITRRMQQGKAKHILLAFDSCYSGLGLTRGSQLSQKQDNRYLNKMMALRSIQVLTAGGRAEQAIEGDGHGLFTDHLLAALSGAADLNADGYVTGTEMYATLRPSVTKRSFNRQTPQFGYIEGEGDFIFSLQEKQTAAPATLHLESMTAGVDVWINGIEKMHGLGPGNHRLAIQSGSNAILVKKGGQTLFRKTVIISPGQEYKIQTAAGQKVMTRQPFSMFTISHPEIKNFSQSLAFDLSDDGQEELITVHNRSLFVFRHDGTVAWKKEFSHKIRLDLVEQFNGQPVIGVSGKGDKTVELYLVDSKGKDVWHQTRRITKQYQGKPDGNGRTVALADIDGDGKDEVMAFTSAGYAWKPRGLIIYDASGREKWRYLTGPSPTSIALWKNRANKYDIILGTYSPGNGNREQHNNTDDNHAYVISISSDGQTNWVQQMGTHFTGVKVAVADLDGNGSDELYAHKWTAYQYRQDEGGVYCFNRSGRITAKFERSDSIKSMVSSKSRRNRPGHLYASDKAGMLYKMNSNLQVNSKKSLNRKSLPMILNLVGVHDYDGDGMDDILFSSFNRYQEGKNPRVDYGPKNKVFFSDMRYTVLSGDLQKTVKEVSIAREWDKWRGFKVIEMTRPEMPHYPFVVLSDKMTVFNY